MEYDKEVLRKLQLTELEILKDIDLFCKKHNIEYFINYGTLIGAVRHGGFIPWDDDIDICMLRGDYERFIELAVKEKEMSDRYDILSLFDTEGYIVPFIKVSKKGTKFTEATNTNKRYKQGIFVDILPFDYVSEDDKTRAANFKKAWMWSRICMLCEIGNPIIPMEIKGLKRKVSSWGCKAVHVFLKLLRFNKNKAFRKYLEYATKYNETGSDLIGEFDDISPERTVMRVDEMFPLREVQFEGISFPAPNNYHKHLTNVYGNYMEEPPVEMRHNHMASELDFGENTN